MTSAGFNNTGKRIGVAILKVLLRHALANIPVYGPSFNVGIDVFDVIRSELSRPLTPDEMAQHLKAVPTPEVNEIIREVLNSTEGRRLTAKLTAGDVSRLNERLKALPSEFGRIVARIDAEEMLKARTAAQAALERREAEFNRLKGGLKGQLERKEFEQAYKAVEQMLSIHPRDKEMLEMQVWLEKRLGRGIDNDVWIWVGGCLLFIIIGALLGGAARPDAIVIMLCIAAVVGLFVSVVKRTWRWIKRKM